MKINEMYRLQGMDPRRFKQIHEDAEIGKQLGNAMSVNVIERIILQILKIIPLHHTMTKFTDKWQTGEAIDKLKETIETINVKHEMYQISQNAPNRVTAPVMASNNRQLMIDSGATYHLISHYHLTEQEKHNRRLVPQPIPLSTANKVIYARWETDIYVPELGIEVTVYILDNCPPVLSLGQLIQQHHYDYFWIHNQQPYLQKDGYRIYCTPVNNVPFLQTEYLSMPSTQPTQQEEDPTPTYSPDISMDQSPWNKDAAPTQIESNSQKQSEQDAFIEEWQMLEEQDDMAHLFGDYPDPEDLTDSQGIQIIDDSESQAQPKSKAKATAKAKRKNTKRKLATGENKHNIFTHFPKDPNCPICRETKVNRVYCRSQPSERPDSLPEPKDFADAVTCDHKILNEEDKSRNQDQNIFVIYDRAKHWLQAYPVETKNHLDTMTSFQRFFGPQIKPKHIFSDNSGEIKKACEIMGYSQDTSRPHRSETNGMAERQVRNVVEGTKSTLVQSGFHEDWWSYAVYAFCFLHCVVDQVVGTQGQQAGTPYFQRFGENFAGPIIPMGAEVTYIPQSKQDKARLHPLGRSTLRGIFLGYKQQAGGGWSQDVDIIDWEEIDTAEHKARVYPRTCHYKEINIQKELNTGNFIFPLANGELNQPGKDNYEMQRIRLKRNRQRQHEERKQEQERQQEFIQEPHQDPVEMPQDFWQVNDETIQRIHRQPRIEY